MERAEDNLADEALRELVIQAAHEGNSRQKTVDKESTLFAIQQELMGDLELDLQQRPMRVGTIVAIRSTRMYVLLDGLPMEVKVYTECLEEYLAEPFEASDVALSSPSFRFRLGQEVKLRTQAWDQNKRRVVLVPVSPD
jgi:exoribonuclease R